MTFLEGIQSCAVIVTMQHILYLPCMLHDRHGLVDGELKHLTPIQSVSCEGEISNNGKLGDSGNLDIY